MAVRRTRTRAPEPEMAVKLACLCGAEVIMRADGLRRWAQCNAILVERGEPELLAHEVAVCSACYARRQVYRDELDQLAREEFASVMHDLQADPPLVVSEERMAHVLRGPFGDDFRHYLKRMKLTTPRVRPASSWDRVNGGSE